MAISYPSNFNLAIISYAGLSLSSPVFPLYDTPNIAILPAGRIFFFFFQTNSGIELFVSRANFIIFAVSGAFA